MGDTSKHLKYFKVENFKRFESFEMNDLGQFNLIVGDNNVGKTSVLEALLVDVPAFIFINNLLTALSFRKIKSNFVYNDLQLYSNQETILGKGRGESIKFHFITKSDEQSDIQIEFGKSSMINITGIPNDSTGYPGFENAAINQNISTPFLPFYKGHDRDLTNFFSREILKSRLNKEKFINSLRVIIPDIEDIQLSSPDPKEYGYLIVSQKTLNSTIPFALFGDGAMKLFRILVEITINKGKRLMIDEVDTGIHFSRYKEFWKTILLAAKENDVQLFMTTHNEECIKYFVDVFNDSDLQGSKSDVRNIALIELPDKTVKAYTYSFDQLEANVHVGNEVRGGSR